MLQIYPLGFLFLVCASGERMSRHSRFTHCHDRNGFNMTLLGEIDAGSVLECGAFCLQANQCKSASFLEMDKRCILSSTGYRFNNSKCDCLQEEKNTSFIYLDYPCYFQMPFVNGACRCSEGYTGERCENPPRDCADYTPASCSVKYERIIYPFGGTSCHGVTVFCAQCIRLTLFRAPNGRFLNNRDAGWYRYKKGFGRDGDPEYWLGNENIHLITVNPHYKYKMSLFLKPANSGGASWDIYFSVDVGNESSGYALTFDHYAESGLQVSIISNGSSFSCHDRGDNDCARQRGAAFWYPTTCDFPPLLNGTYFINNEFLQLSYFHSWIERIMA